MAKRGRKILGDHKLTSTESKRKHDDLYASIDTQLDQARMLIDWERRKSAEESLEKWV